MEILRKLRSLLKLYRADVAVLVFFGTLAGRRLTTELTWIHLIQAAFVSFFLYNFVYTLNAITDMTEDSINKPWRPLPSGNIRKNEAFLWLGFLTVVSATLIPVLFSGIEIFLAYLVMFLGMSYSIPPFTFKKRPLIAPLITGWGIVHPLFLTGKTKILLISISLLLHGFAVTFLKDLSDVKGDKQAGRTVITEIISIPKLVILSNLLNMISSLGFFLSNYKAASLIPILSLLTVNYEYILRRKDFSLMIYKNTVRSTVVSSVFITVFYLFII